MRVPLSWLKDFVKITITPEELARKLTFAGLEVEEIEYVGLPLPAPGVLSEAEGAKQEFKTSGIEWDQNKIVVAQILEVMPHPNADRLTLLRLDWGSRKEETVLTGAPNLFQYKGLGPLPKPIKAAYAKEGAILYDGHRPGRELMTLKRAKIRGVDSYSMVCSEKELGISEEHEGIILLDDDAPVGMPLAEYIGDVVFEVKINPNMARDANILGIAREIAALTGQKLKPPSFEALQAGVSLKSKVAVDIREPELNPRFTALLIGDVKIRESPYWMQRRLRLAGMRPINNIVDITNYVMLEVGQPLHAFDYDALVKRAKGKPPTIITRLPKADEHLTTLDGIDRKLDPFTILVCDEKGALSIGGVMGGSESEVWTLTEIIGEAAPGNRVGIKGVRVNGLWTAALIKVLAQEDDLKAFALVGEVVGQANTEWLIRPGDADPTGEPTKVVLITETTTTRNVLLEAAAWNFINIRRTVQAQGLQSSQAGYRFSRGVHPAMAERGCKRAAEMMRKLAGGTVAKGMVDVYPRKPKRAPVDLNENDVERILGIRIPIKQIVKILESLEFECDMLAGTREPTVRAVAPDHRLDIGAGVIGQADVIEEVARIYGYERIPETQIGDTTPPQRANLSLEREEWARDILANVGLQEVVTYRLTTPEREALLMPPGVTKDDRSYVTITNPIAADRCAMRHSVLAAALEVAASNLRFTDRVAMFEIGAVYIARPKPTPSSPLPLPDEPRRLAVVLTGPREPQGWQGADRAPMDFYDLKGVIESLAGGLHLPGVNFEPGEHPSFRPERTAQLVIGGRGVGWMGELHLRVAEAYLKLAGAPGHSAPILAADFDLELILASVPARHITSGVSRFPPVVEDIALIVNEGLAASRVESLIRETGGAVLADVRLFDLFKGDQIGAGKKSLAYRLTYQAEDRTLTDAEAATLREKIVRRAAEVLGAELRG